MLGTIHIDEKNVDIKSWGLNIILGAESNSQNGTRSRYRFIPLCH